MGSVKETGVAQGNGKQATPAATGLTRRSVLKGAVAASLVSTVPGVVDPKRVVAVAARQADNGATLIVGISSSPSDIDPHSMYDYGGSMVCRSVYDALVGMKGSSTEDLEGLIAESWEANDNQSVWTFKIRPNVTFQDGTPVDSAAVKASYERLLAMDTGPVAIVSRFIATPEQMTTPDAATIVFDCGVPQPFFISAMASNYGTHIVNVKAAMEHEEDGDYGNAWLQLNAEGTGSGAWRITAFEPGQDVVMERNPDYWRGWDGNHFDRVILRVVPETSVMRQLVESGDVDIMDRFAIEFNWIDEFKKNENLTVDVSESTEVAYFPMTVAGPLASREARQAMAYAFPYDETLQGVYYGYAARANSGIASTVFGFQKDGYYFQTDLDKAKELLAQAGVPEGTALTLTLNETETPVPAQLFQANLAKIGITLDIETLDDGSYAALFYGDMPAEERPNFLSSSWWPDYNDAWNDIYPQISCNQQGSAGANAGFYCNEDVETLLTEAKDASTLETYTDVLDKMQTIITRDDVPAIAISQPKWTTVLQKNVQGFAFNPINLGTYYFWEMSRTSS